MDKNVIKDRRRKISPEQAAEIVKRRAAGERLIALAEEFGISRQRVDIIAKGIKAKSRRAAPRVSLTQEHLDWLDGVIAKSKRSYRIASLEKKVLRKFGIRFHPGPHLLWFVQRNVIISDYDKDLVFSREFDEYLRSDHARKVREREAIWLAKQQDIKPKRGRKKITPIAEIAPIADLDDLDDDDDDDEPDFLSPNPSPGTDTEDESDWEGETLTIEQMLASVEETRRKLAAKGRPKPGLKPQAHFRPPGVRTGKHAKAAQPAKKKKRKK